MRSLEELTSTDEPAWPLVQGWITEAAVPVEVLPASDPARGKALHATQVTVRSPMGAIIYESGGLLVDHGWLRILGSGHPRFPRSLPQWNAECYPDAPEGPPPIVLIADDVVGGFFAIDGGGLGINPGEVAYFAPDTLKWEGTEKGYSDFIVWCFSSAHERFYEGYRRPGWKELVGKLGGNQGYGIYPPPFTDGVPPADRSWKPVPMKELFLWSQDMAEQMRDLPPGSQIIFREGPRPDRGK